MITTAPTKIASVQLDGNVNQVVKAHTKSLCEASGAYLDEYDVRTYHEVRIIFGGGGAGRGG